MINVTLYTRPSGTKEVHECHGILLEDEKFFKEHDIELSAEAMTVGYVIYGDYSKAMGYDIDSDGEYEHMIVADGDMTSEEAFSALRRSIEIIFY